MCADTLAALPNWAAGRLDPAARRAVEAHLRSCADCRAEADAWTALSHAATAFGAAAGPPPAWRSPLAADGATVAVPPPIRWRFRPVVRVAVAAAAAAAVVAIGGGLVVRGPARDGDLAVGGPPAQASPTLVARVPTTVARLVAGKGERANRTGLDSIRTDAEQSARVKSMFHPTGLAALGSLAANRFAAAVPTVAQPNSAPSTVAAGDGSPSNPDAASSTSSARPAPATPEAPPLSPVPPTSEPTSQPPPASPTAPASHPPNRPPPGAAIVTGIVTGPDGFERAEVDIIALPFDTSEAQRTASTGATGAFTLTLPAGRWSIHAESPAYLPAWPDGALTPLDGAPIDVAEGGVARLRFTLSAAAWGAIRGRVVDAAGAPVAGALVLAAAPDTERGGYTAFVAAAFADADGRYALAVDEGAWLVAAATDWRTPYLTWWGGNGDLVAVDWVAVSRERAADGIDIRLRE